MWVWVLVGIALLVILFYRPRENMSNDQLISTLKQFGDTSSSGTSEKPIYGPSANPPPVPTNRGAGGGKTVAGPYPQIFGPDVTGAPGTTGSGSQGVGNVAGGPTNGVNGVGGLADGCSNGSGTGQVGANGGSSNGYVFSDQPGPADMAHEFNPDLAKAFPVDGPPQPFLTDFSRIQH
jgi:hypothetical protein